MAANSKIEWTDATWNPVTGCSVVSPGCTNCYAMKLAGTRLAHLPSRAGLTRDSKAGPVWTGEVRLNEEWLTQPLRWRRPRLIFVCAHGDLFAEGVPDDWIDRVFAVMALAPQHTFQVLTKRASRMREYLCNLKTPARIASDALHETTAGLPARTPLVFNAAWPLPHVWLGVSVEDQARANERIPHLLTTPAAVRFVSAEPLLSRVNFKELSPNGVQVLDALNGRSWTPDYSGWPHLDWVIVGAESGPGARPMQVEWARSIVAQCRAAGVACFVKQLSSGGPHPIKDMAHFPDDLRVREMPAAMAQHKEGEE